MVDKYSKSNKLQTDFNTFWNKILGEDQDYFDMMSMEDLYALKAALSNVNNIITLDSTLKAVHRIADILQLKKEQVIEILHVVDSTKPNDNGFDIEYKDEKSRFICEVKCNRPINGGNRFGSAQKNGLTKDIESLLFGKSKSSIRKEEMDFYYKFMVIYEFDQKTKEATDHYLSLMKKEYMDKVRLFNGEIELSKDVVYILMVT